MQSSNYNAQEKAFTSRLFLGPEKVLHVCEEKDLGVVISDKLTWDSHVHWLQQKKTNF